MGLIDRLMGLLFSQRNVIVETAEVFRENAEAASQRHADLNAAALAQFAAEFQRARTGRFDSVMDGINRIPRPAMALGTVGLFGAAMWDPLWFAERMVGLSVVPEPLWWLLGAIVSFYFGARHQAKGQAFQRDVATTMVRAPEAIQALKELDGIRQERGHEPEEHLASNGRSTPPRRAAPRPRAAPDGNAALDDWRAGHG
ncbi:holin family protein [Oceaniglobus indicus]|uniref:holin family protein n=1 Tax=Oceaniglobus indicus TaxID=2047749 RepID=UPI000C1A65A7|nr:holin family protein [Oceaniglobus indicus]